MERRIAVFTSVLVLALLVCICVTVGGTILKYEGERLARDVKAIQKLYLELEGDRFRSLEAETSLLSDLPQLRAMMATKDAPTINDALNGFRVLIHADFLDAFDETDRGYNPEGASTVEALVANVRSSGKAQHGYVDDHGALRQVVAVPVKNGEVAMGTLVAGYRFGDDLLTRLKEMTRAEFAVIGEDARVMHATPAGAQFVKTATSVPGNEFVQGLPELVSEPGERGEYIVAASQLTSATGEKVAKLLSLRALSEGLQIANKLRTNTIVLSTLFCFIGIALSLLFARSISRPLRTLANRLAAVDPSDTEKLKSITEATDGIGADRDVQSLLASFDELVRALSRSRETTDDGLVQRTQGLEAEVESVREQNAKLAATNQRLLELIEKRDPDKGAA
ncbi:MAG: hypothetical protein HY075_13900 [Deltaproteobacteria bacterium]|nr:hypothetical protein [Deltaproteobacteria bacterium]